ncbi:hypothetical protein AVEN_75516-1 [Araneus ventricosus]|uniref:Integrase catalytic domain-containing protein n=1 Tax=Araneus ventricosus TaxID=182803 RepID=A0A4Y2DMS5_ARAVE|nr:hypothetical protein AVEN_75516-1 [Araneus ventricosus]
MHDLLAQSIFSSQRLAGRVVRTTGLGSDISGVRIRGCLRTLFLLYFAMSLTWQACDKFDAWCLTRLLSFVSSLHSCRVKFVASLQICRASLLQTKIAIWVATKPWSRVYIDFAGPFQGQMFFLLVNSFSKWLEVKRLSSATSSATIRVMREMFATHGIPDLVAYDNGS